MPPNTYVRNFTLLLKRTCKSSTFLETFGSVLLFAIALRMGPRNSVATASNTGPSCTLAASDPNMPPRPPTMPPTTESMTPPPEPPEPELPSWVGVGLMSSVSESSVTAEGFSSTLFSSPEEDDDGGRVRVPGPFEGRLMSVTGLVGGLVLDDAAC